MSERGYSLMELMLAGAISGIIIVGGMQFFSKVVPMLNRTRGRQQVQMQSRALIDTITERLRNGKGDTVSISTPLEANIVPNSRIDFVFQTPLMSGATGYAIYLSSGAVYVQEFGPPMGARAPALLAKNVTSLMFTGNSTDPGIVAVSLRMDVPYDSTDDPTHVATLVLPDQTVRMVETQ